MKITSYKSPKSSFLSIEKDLALITDKILANNRIKKLLYYDSRDALTRPNLTDDQSLGLFGKQIKIIPKLQIDPEAFSYIIISFDDFLYNVTNPAFRDNTINFDIICHYNQWQMKDFQLRPYKIAAEIDSMFNNERLTGIGTLQFIRMNQIVINDEFIGLTMSYLALHGEEDKKNMLTPEDEIQFLNDYFDIEQVDNEEE